MTGTFSRLPWAQQASGAVLFFIFFARPVAKVGPDRHALACEACVGPGPSVATLGRAAVVVVVVVVAIVVNFGRSHSLLLMLLLPCGRRRRYVPSSVRAFFFAVDMRTALLSKTC